MAKVMCAASKVRSSFQMFTNSASSMSTGTGTAAAVGAAMTSIANAIPISRRMRMVMRCPVPLAGVRQLQREASSVLPDGLRQQLGAHGIGVLGAKEIARREREIEMLRDLSSHGPIDDSERGRFVAVAGQARALPDRFEPAVHRLPGRGRDVSLEQDAGGIVELRTAVVGGARKRAAERGPYSVLPPHLERELGAVALDGPGIVVPVRLAHRLELLVDQAGHF